LDEKLKKNIACNSNLSVDNDLILKGIPYCFFIKYVLKVN
jgi:hypothetical protein